MSEEPARAAVTGSVAGRITGARPPSVAPDVDLAARGYVLEEHVLEGTAAPSTCSKSRPLTDAGRSPSTPGRRTAPGCSCSVRTARPTATAPWSSAVAERVRRLRERRTDHGEVYEGYAWVGVSAQEVGLYGFPAGMDRMASRRAVPLLEHDPERYGDLHHPGDQVAFDLFTQAGRVLAPDRDLDLDVDPLGDLPVERLVAAGGSQSAMRLATYLNTIHPVERVFDGFLLSVWEAHAPRPEEGVLPMGVRTAIRTDTPSPVVIVNSEFESTQLAQVPCVDTEWLRRCGRSRARLTATPAHVSTKPTAGGRVANQLRYAPVHDAALPARCTTGWPTELRRRTNRASRWTRPSAAHRDR